MIKLILTTNLAIIANVNGHNLKESTLKLVSDLVGNFFIPPTQIGAFLCSDGGLLKNIQIKTRSFFY